VQWRIEIEEMMPVEVQSIWQEFTAQKKTKSTVPFISKLARVDTGIVAVGNITDRLSRRQL
jgi:hypothetical protein